MGGSKFDRIFFRIKVTCCAIEKKIRIINFQWNALKMDNGIVHFKPYPEENDYIVSVVLDEAMHEGGLQIMRMGRSESGNTWLTLREILSINNSKSIMLTEAHLGHLIKMVNKNVIRFTFIDTNKEVLVTANENEVTAQEVSLDHPDLTVADYKSDHDLLKKIKEENEEELNLKSKEKNPADGTTVIKTGKNFNNGNSGEVNKNNNINDTDCEDCVGSKELDHLEKKNCYPKNFT